MCTLQVLASDEILSSDEPVSSSEEDEEEDDLGMSSFYKFLFINHSDASFTLRRIQGKKIILKSALKNRHKFFQVFHGLKSYIVSSMCYLLVWIFFKMSLSLLIFRFFVRYILHKYRTTTSDNENCVPSCTNLRTKVSVTVKLLNFSRIL